MPELPEVETTLKGIEPYVLNQTIKYCLVKQRQLRWLVDAHFPQKVQDRKVCALKRRGKYLVFALEHGRSFLIHLGMSGSLRVCEPGLGYRKHDHVIFTLNSNVHLRFHDPRRFGSVVWCDCAVDEHPLIRSLGVEPLGQEFHGEYLYQRARRRTTAIKNFIMNARVVVGVGNIYANEALFMAGIHPKRPANRISLLRMSQLANAIQIILKEAIAEGGTTLKDFVNSKNEPGYFSQKLRVYGKAGSSCQECGSLLKFLCLGQRSTVYCAVCQT